MNILWFSHFLPYPPKGGGNQRSYNLIRELSKSHQIHLLIVDCLNTDNATANAALSEICVDVKILHFCQGRLRRSWQIARNVFSSKPYTVDRLRSAFIRTSFKQYAAKIAPDLMHFDGLELCEYIDEAPGSCIKILNHHDIESHKMLRRFTCELNLIKKLYFAWEALRLRWYEKRMCAKFNYNITVSELDRARLLNLCGNIKIGVVPNGVDTNYFRHNDQTTAEAASLFFAGRMTHYPNHDAMIFFLNEIWPILKRELPQTKIAIVGADPSRCLLNISKRDGNVFIVGFVEDVRPYFERAEIFICPIRCGGGTKVKILDALAMGKPTVAHPVAVEGLDVENNRHLLIAQTPRQFVDCIIRLVKDGRLRARLSLEGRKLAVDKYDFKKIGAEMAHLYENAR